MFWYWTFKDLDIFVEVLKYFVYWSQSYWLKMTQELKSSFPYFLELQHYFIVVCQTSQICLQLSSTLSYLRFIPIKKILLWQVWKHVFTSIFFLDDVCKLAMKHLKILNIFSITLYLLIGLLSNLPLTATTSI